MSQLATRETINQVKAFHAYCLLGGDCRRVAILFRTTPDVIESLAHDFNWRQQITGLARMDNESGLTEQQEIHRVGVFIVAERAKQIFVNLFEKLETDPDFAQSLTTKKLFKDDETEIIFDGKALLDLVKGYEALTNLSYRALGDKSASKGSDDSPANTAAASIALYQQLQNRFGQMLKVDATSEVGKVLKDVTPR